MSRLPRINELLEQSKSIAERAGVRLSSFTDEHKRYFHDADMAKEIKAVADKILEQDILQALLPAGLPILTEESGEIPSQDRSGYRFIVDPLDGTFNFVKGLGPSAVSIALWHRDTPVFGVICCLPERQMFWGGAGIGSFVDGRPIFVSATSNAAQASICTGFPVRFDMTSDTVMQTFWQTIKPYAKVRMIGAAAVSLVHVARGSADAYLEKNIMLWDVAAGIAIVEGAGGKVRCGPGTVEHSLDVRASNGILSMAD
jgi:myo-inositol-1(or 4)-monophosphatase